LTDMMIPYLIKKLIHVLFLSILGLLTYWNNSLSNSNSLRFYYFI
jgi:hypothetical protein